jgi:hypothetical protein
VPKLDTLEEQYREAQAEFREDRTPENKKKYRNAKQRFALARVEVRQQEEADPEHARGTTMVTVTNDEDEEA